MRIAAVLRIKHTTQRAHRVEVVLGELLLHEIYLFHTDAVLARHAAAEFNALVQNVVARRERAFHLIGIALIIQHQGMNIAVAGVKDIRDAQAVFPARRADEAHDLGQLRARHHAVLGEIIRTEPADSAERAFAAFPEQSTFVVVFRQTHFAGSIRFADFDDASGLFFESGCHPVQFHDQHRAGIERKAEVIGGFDRLRDELVHHLQRAGHNACGDNFADRLARVVHALEHAQHRFVSLRRADEPDQHLRDDAEHPFTADHRAAQIVAVHLLAAFGLRSEPDNFAVRQDHFETQHMVGRDAIFQRVWATGVGSHIAADGTGRLAGRVRREEQAPRLYRVGDPGVDAAGFDQRAVIAMVHRKNPVHPRQRDHHSAGDCQHTTAQTRSRATGNDRDIVFRAELDDRDDLFGGLWQGDEIRKILFERISVAFVNEQFLRFRHHAILADDGAELVNQLRGIFVHRCWHTTTLSKRTRAVERTSPATTKQAQIESRRCVRHQIRQHFANYAGEFETVARTRTGDQHLRVLRMPVNEEMMVGRVGVHADDRCPQIALPAGKELSYQSAHRCDFLWRHLATDGIGIDDLALVMTRDLHAVAQVGKTVEISARFVFPDVNRTAVGLKPGWILWLEPELNLTFDVEGQFHVRQ